MVHAVRRLGMLADALLKSTDNPAASQIYKKILGREAAQVRAAGHRVHAPVCAFHLVYMHA